MVTSLYILLENFSQTVPDLCWELAQLQDTYILQGIRHLCINSDLGSLVIDVNMSSLFVVDDNLTT